jgi:hypothetical protein
MDKSITVVRKTVVLEPFVKYFSLYHFYPKITDIQYICSNFAFLSIISASPKLICINFQAGEAFSKDFL